MEKYSLYYYKISFEEEQDKKRYVYEISSHPSDLHPIRESDEWFDTELEAKEAAIEHIEALEDGER